MTTEREYREGKNRQNFSKRPPKKGKKLALWLSVIIVIFSIFTVIKNNPKLITNIDYQKVESFFDIFNINISAIKSLTGEFVVDINEEILPGDNLNLNDNQFLALDQQAKSIQYYGNSVSELADLLVQYAYTDLEKARLIYTWISHNISYDVSALLALKNGSYPDVTSKNVLDRRTTICSGYANLYQQIADYMGLKSVIVLGYAKGSDYIVGDDNDVNHAWNAVKIDEQWYLVDPTWGAGTVTNNKFNPKFNPYYFATPADEFIYSHFPENEKWQLREIPLAREEFDSLPEVSTALFKNDIELISHKSNPIYTHNRLNITLKAPKNIVAVANLKSANSELKDNYTLVQNYNGYINVNTAFPSKGNYILDIFAKPKDNSNYYPHVISYEIKASNSTHEFPTTYRHFVQNNGYLETPLNQFLIPNQLTYFKLKIDNATEVKVVDKSTNKWNNLIKNGNLFVGNVRVSSGKILVFAKFPGDSRYWALLEYN